MKLKFLQKMKTMATGLAMTSKRCLGYVALGFASCATASAQATTDMGTRALADVTAKVAAYVPFVQNLIYAIAGVVAVVGAIQVYMKMNNGDQDVSKSIMMLIGACLFLVAAAVALPKFFGVG